jgi:colanic acid biosynthesis glycosyl transferase WcaI
MSILSRCARDELNETLNACDIAVISFAQGMSGVSVPSRMYNIMAAGKPILAITDNDSELAMVVREEKIGWVVSPGDIEDLKKVLHEAISSKEQLIGMGERARKAAQLKYSLQGVVDGYREFLDTI